MCRPYLEAQQRLIERERAFAPSHGDPNRGLDHVTGRLRRGHRTRGLSHFHQVAVWVADEHSPIRRVERDTTNRHDRRAPRLQSSHDGIEVTDREDQFRRARVPGVGLPFTARTSKNSDSSSPNGVLAARMKTVRKRDPCVLVRSQTSASEPACDTGRIGLGQRVGGCGSGANGDRASSMPNTSR